MSLGSDCPVVILASGQTLRVRQVMLYEEDRVVEVAQLRANAANHTVLLAASFELKRRMVASASRSSAHARCTSSTVWRLS
jgi:hypothetical protein